MEEKVRVRFAPSPTGYLHVGGAHTALFNFLFARSKGGKFILRIEDTDKEQSHKIYEEKIMEDLHWLGLNWDEGPDIGGNYKPYRQSEREEIYKHYLNILKEKDLIYPCYCTPEELERKRRLDLKRGIAPKYDRRCLYLSEKERKSLETSGRKPALRFKVSPQKISFQDLIKGKIEFDTALFGDFVLIKQDNTPTFFFASTVDDIEMKITSVLRGEDHLSNTPRQILIYSALGFSPPSFGHLPIMLAPNRKKLSKREGPVSISEYRQMGYLPSALINYLAIISLSPEEKTTEFFSLNELIKIFSLDRVSKSAAIFDKKRLNWMNSYYIRHLDLNELTEMILPYFEKSKETRIITYDREKFKKMISVVKDEVTTLNEFREKTEIFWKKEKDINIKDKSTLKVLTYLLKELEGVEVWEEKYLQDILRKDAQLLNMSAKEIFLPLRIVLTGKNKGPELPKIMEILGKEETLQRLSQYLTRDRDWDLEIENSKLETMNNA